MSTNHSDLLGMGVAELPTPSLLVDLDAFEANCRTLSGHLSARGRQWRPHIKAHKSPVLARRMIEAGAVGVTCAKVGEAEEMVAGGVPSALIANQLATPDAWSRLARLQHAAWVGVAVDDPVHVRSALEAGAAHGVAIPLLVEVDIGMDRAGVRSADRAAKLATEIVSSGGRFDGVMGYEGHLLTVQPEEEKRKAVTAAIEILLAAAELIRNESIPVPIVSCGGTGSYLITSEIDGVTELQAGGGCLMDRFYAERCGVELEPALLLVAGVTSRPTPDRAILDAGWKAIPDRLNPPVCRDIPGARVDRLYAEHMRLELDGVDLRIGDRVILVPGYSDATTVLHDVFVGIRDGTVAEVIPLTARGALQ